MDLFYPASREASRIFISHIAWEKPWIRTGLSWYGCAGAASAGAGADVVPEDSGEAPAGAGATPNRPYQGLHLQEQVKNVFKFKFNILFQ